MPIPFNCPSCGARTLVADQFAGQTGPCASCGATITIPVVAPKGHGSADKPSPRRSEGMSVGIIVAVVLVGLFLLLLTCGGIGFLGLRGPMAAVRIASERSRSQNNLKQIALAMHNYHDAHGCLPPAFTLDKDGKKLHSWRTLILPYLGEHVLYSQIDLTTPWDSPRNAALSQQVVGAYSYDGNSTITDYVVVTGPDTIFDDSKPMTMQGILDGTSNTLLAVEVSNSGISWMEPRDLTIDEWTRAVAVGPSPGRPPQGYNVALGDGSVRFLEYSLDSRQLRALATRAGGELIVLP